MLCKIKLENRSKPKYKNKCRKNYTEYLLYLSFFFIFTFLIF